MAVVLISNDSVFVAILLKKKMPREFLFFDVSCWKKWVVSCEMGKDDVITEFNKLKSFHYCDPGWLEQLETLLATGIEISQEMERSLVLVVGIN
uniref:Uncharacterized protein n=1 Tax=Strigamia maritima TaxID=126957 RepID=T1JK85_STRMM